MSDENEILEEWLRQLSTEENPTDFLRYDEDGRGWVDESVLPSLLTVLEKYRKESLKNTLENLRNTYREEAQDLPASELVVPMRDIETALFPSWTSSPAATPLCGCLECSADAQAGRIMCLCSNCGCKRCPHATFHNHSCSQDNTPGQPGSQYQGGPCKNVDCASSYCRTERFNLIPHLFVDSIFPHFRDSCGQCGRDRNDARHTEEAE